MPIDPNRMSGSDGIICAYIVQTKTCDVIRTSWSRVTFCASDAKGYDGSSQTVDSPSFHRSAFFFTVARLATRPR